MESSNNKDAIILSILDKPESDNLMIASFIAGMRAKEHPAAQIEPKKLDLSSCLPP